MTIVYPLKIDEEIMPLIELKSKEEHTNKAIVIKQLLYKGLNDYVLELISKGRLSVGRAVEILNISVYDMHEMAKSKNIKLSASVEQRQKSRGNITKILKKIHK